MADSNENAPVEELKMCQLKAKGLMEEIDRHASMQHVGKKEIVYFPEEPNNTIYLLKENY